MLWQDAVIYGLLAALHVYISRGGLGWLGSAMATPLLLTGFSMPMPNPLIWIPLSFILPGLASAALSSPLGGGSLFDRSTKCFGEASSSLPASVADFPLPGS